jgi:hypothetical protein
MTTLPLTITCSFDPRRRKGASRTQHPPRPAWRHPAVPPGRVPRVARLLALAIRLERLRRAGVVANYAALARLGHVSRARVTQIMNLLMLAPDIQEALLFLPRTERGRDPIQLRQLQRLTRVVNWGEQRKLWQALQAKGQSGQPQGCPKASPGRAPSC